MRILWSRRFHSPRRFALTRGCGSYAKVAPSPQTEQTVDTRHHLWILRLTARTLSVKLKH